MQLADRLRPLVFSTDGRISTPLVLFLALTVSLLGGLLVALLGGPISVGLIVGVGFGVWVLRDIEMGYLALIAIVCLIPFGTLPVNLGFKPTFLDLIVIALFVVWLFQRASGKHGKLITVPVGLPLLVFLALIIAAFIAGLGNAPLTQTVARNFAEVLLSLVLFFMVVDSVRDEAHLVKFVRVIVIAGLLASLVAIVLYILPDRTSMELLSRLGVFGYPEGPGVLRFIRDDPSLAQRATGTSVDPNVLGGLLIMTLSVTVTQVYARAEHAVLRRRWAILGSASMALALVLTFSRGSFIGAGVAMFGLGLFRYRKILLALLIALVVMLTLPDTQDYATHFFEGVRGEDLATQMRFGEYSDALTLIGRYPLLGVGFTGSPDLDTYIGVASVYLLMAQEIGLVGLAAFLLVMLTLFVWALSARRVIHRHAALEPMWWGLHAALIGAMVGGVFDHYFFNLDFHHSVVFFWLFVSLAASATRLALHAENLTPERTR